MKLTPKAARVNAGLGQAEAAERLGIHKTTLSNYETGKTMPGMKTGMNMAELYGISIDDFYFCKSNSL